MTAGVYIQYTASQAYFNQKHITSLNIRGAHNGSGVISPDTSSTIEVQDALFFTLGTGGPSADGCSTIISDVNIISRSTTHNGLLFDMIVPDAAVNNNNVSLSRCTIKNLDCTLSDWGFAKIYGHVIFSFENGNMIGIGGGTRFAFISHATAIDSAGKPNTFKLTNTNLVKAAGNPGHYIIVYCGTNSWPTYYCSLDNVTMYDANGPDFSIASIRDDAPTGTGTYGLSIESGVITNNGSPGLGSSGTIINLTFQPYIISRDLRNPLW